MSIEFLLLDVWHRTNYRAETSLTNNNPALLSVQNLFDKREVCARIKARCCCTKENQLLNSDYVHDPYNLTLQIDNSNNINGSQVPANPTSTFFQSSSYFINDASDLIPPGSELFNRP